MWAIKNGDLEQVKDIIEKQVVIKLILPGRTFYANKFTMIETVFELVCSP